MFSSRIVGTAFRLSRTQARNYSTAPKPGGFFGKILDNLKQELSKDKEMKDNIAKFREERKKLEQSDALKQARRKFEIVESEASKGSEALKETLDSVKGKLQETIKEAGQSEFAKKASEVGGQLGKQAQSVADQAAKFSSTSTYKAMSGAAAVMKDEIVESSYGDRIYRPPIKLRKRVEDSGKVEDQQIITPNEEAMGVELHKDSKFYQSWENFKDSNPYVNRMLDWKIKYEESDNPVFRASRAVTEKVSELFGGLFQRTELSEVLTEIMTLDPGFEKEKFLVYCEKEIIPNVLEAMCRQDAEILRDWCYDAAYAVMSHPIEACKQRGLKMDSKVLDISHVDLAMGRVLEQGPVLVVTFTAQMVSTVRDATGKVVEGDPEKVMRVNHAWVLCRDRAELNPQAAWRLLEFSASSSEQLL
ncbi:unnamed protein product [Allacma fusca]|uniref:Mitochondrial import inner membrane translocase subunit TIM44 n=1 Tax=Allacma fusca TaxID=39272 RepID=A0A8J2LRR6_9HEXA|nr:unnamed protein product [Allacma fusca]